MKMQQTVLMGIALSVALTGHSNATPVTVPNSSFENPGVPNFTFASSGNTAVMDWTIAGTGAGVFNPVGSESTANEYFNPGFPTDGSQSAFVVAQTSLTSADLGPIQGNVRYDLQVDVAARTDTPLFPFQLDLLAGGVSFAHLTGSPGSIAAGDFVTENLQFEVFNGSPLIGQALGIMLSAAGSVSDTGQVNFDNVRLDAIPLPEPGCLALVCCAVASGAGWWLVRGRQETKRG